MRDKKRTIYEKIISGLVTHVDPRTRLAGYVYSLAKRYCSAYQGENDPDYHTNGQRNFYKKLVLSGNTKLVVIVGANIGEMSNYLLSLEKGIEVHCFEPDPRAFKILQTKLNVSNAVLNQLAVGDRVEIKPMHMHKKFSEWNTFHVYPHRLKEFRSQSVKVTTLDSYLSGKNISHVDLLKIDTEGHDFFVLKGTSRYLQRAAIDVIIFEYGEVSMLSRQLFYDIYSYLEGNGYRVYKIMPNYLKRIRYSPDDERCFYANFVAIRRDFNIGSIETDD